MLNANLCRWQISKTLYPYKLYTVSTPFPLNYFGNAVSIQSRVRFRCSFPVQRNRGVCYAIKRVQRWGCKILGKSRSDRKGVRGAREKKGSWKCEGVKKKKKDCKGWKCILISILKKSAVRHWWQTFLHILIIDMKIIIMLGLAQHTSYKIFNMFGFSKNKIYMSHF